MRNAFSGYDFAPYLTRLASLAFPFLVATMTSVAAADIDTDVQINVVPFVQFSYVGGDLLYLQIPPAGSTVGASSSVTFKVSGNAFATMIAAPDEFLLIPPNAFDDGGWMGKAILGSNVLGYKLLLTFPRTAPVGCGCGIVKNASLPLDTPSPTDPLSVNLALTSGVRQGSIDLIANPAWTTHGGLPAAGLYEGGIVLTVTAHD